MAAFRDGEGSFQPSFGGPRTPNFSRKYNHNAVANYGQNCYTPNRSVSPLTSLQELHRNSGQPFKISRKIPDLDR